MRFRDEYFFLSNFFPHVQTMYLDNTKVTIPTAEHCYAAMKAKYLKDARTIAESKTPGQAKRLGRKVVQRPDWESIKVDVMRDILMVKFRDKDLLGQLEEITEPIVEHNQWHDNFWGSCTCDKCGDDGGNQLGILLMQIRDQLTNQQEQE